MAASTRFELATSGLTGHSRALRPPNPDAVRISIRALPTPHCGACRRLSSRVQGQHTDSFRHPAFHERRGPTGRSRFSVIAPKLAKRKTGATLTILSSAGTARRVGVEARMVAEGSGLLLEAEESPVRLLERDTGRRSGRHRVGP